jgi:hypothetical protein
LALGYISKFLKEKKLIFLKIIMDESRRIAYFSSVDMNSKQIDRQLHKIEIQRSRILNQALKQAEADMAEAEGRVQEIMGQMSGLAPRKHGGLGRRGRPLGKRGPGRPKMGRIAKKAKRLGRKMGRTQRGKASELIEKVLRAKSPISMSELASEAGVSMPTVNNWIAKEKSRITRQKDGRRVLITLKG